MLLRALGDDHSNPRLQNIYSNFTPTRGLLKIACQGSFGPQEQQAARWDKTS